MWVCVTEFSLHISIYYILYIVSVFWCNKKYLKRQQSLLNILDKNQILLEQNVNLIINHKISHCFIKSLLYKKQKQKQRHSHFVLMEWGHFLWLCFTTWKIKKFFKDFFLDWCFILFLFLFIFYFHFLKQTNKK